MTAIYMAHKKEMCSSFNCLNHFYPIFGSVVSQVGGRALLQGASTCCVSSPSLSQSFQATRPMRKHLLLVALVSWNGSDRRWGPPYTPHWGSLNNIVPCPPGCHCLWSPMQQTLRTANRTSCNKTINRNKVSTCVHFFQLGVYISSWFKILKHKKVLNICPWESTTVL